MAAGVGPLRALALLLLWTAAAVQDLRERRVSVLVLAPLAALSLVGRAWPWWLLAAAALVWPPRWKGWVTVLVPLALAAGAVTGDPAPALALAAAVIAWALNWWGGADGVALQALALGHGLAGLVAGSLGALLAGLAVLAVRRRPLRGLLTAAWNVMARRQLDPEIPPEREMPAAAVFAAAGAAMEVYTLWQMFG